MKPRAPRDAGSRSTAEGTSKTKPGAEGDSSPCQACGACCAHDHSWYRFTLESDDEIARIPEGLIAADGSGMRCEGERCLALAGQIGVATSCTIYAARPIVCRDCLPGDDACTMARAARGLAAIEA